MIVLIIDESVFFLFFIINEMEKSVTGKATLNYKLVWSS